MIDKDKYVISKSPKLKSWEPYVGRRGRTIHRDEIETALWKLGANYYQLTKDEEDLILKLAKRF